MTNSDTTSALKHQCLVCNASFRRAEHLKRHSRSHSSERPFACGTCSKRFARSDILHRHEASHETAGDRGAYRLATRTFRACQQCALARQRCTGDFPCARCSKRTLSCTYPEDKKAHQPSLTGESSTTTTSMPYEGSFGVDHDRANHYQLAQPPTPTRNSTISDLQTQSGIVPPVVAHRTDATAPPWYSGPFNVDEFSGDLPTFDDWWNPNHWIPLSIYASPYGPDLEEEFRYILPSNHDAQSTQGSIPDLSLPPFQSPTIPNSIGQPVQQCNRRDSGSITGSALYLGSPVALPMDGAGVSSETFAEDMGPTSDHRYKRRRIDPVPESRPHGSHNQFAFPSEDHFNWEGLSKSDENPTFITSEAYLKMYKNFWKLCLEPDFTPSPFQTNCFPSKNLVEHCIDSYFEQFHKQFPLVHKTSLMRDGNWILLLATATIGSSFANSTELVSLRNAFQEFLRRSITVHAVSQDRQDPEAFVPFSQARLLNLLGLAQSGLEQHRNLVPQYHAELARSCLELGLLQATGFTDPADPSNLSQDLTKRWEAWVKQESRRRSGYFIWFIDCALAYLSNSGPLCSMDDARAPMPSPEEPWDAESAISWSQMPIPEQPSLCQSMETLYLKKQVSSSMSELGHILLVHALYQKTWETGKHLKQPLSNWSPNANTKGFIATPSKDTFWLPSYPLYANWRNSACDCLDVLHWYASSVIARAAGIEHNAVLHLHLARIVLLTPFQEIQDLCSSLINRYGQTKAASFYVHDGSYQTQNPAKLPQIRKITWRWLREDQHKARLAMIHAGSVFWHVRRYSSNSFFEPTAVYLASIVLWTYGSYKTAALSQTNGTGIGAGVAQEVATEHRRETEHGTGSAEGLVEPVTVENGETDDHHTTITANNQISATGGSANQDLHHSATSPAHASSQSSPVLSEYPIDHPQFIHLDRPCDDEMVQHFVRHGHNMDGHMSNVGDICVSPQKILLEGAKLLKTRLWKWGISQEYHSRLKELAALRKGS